MIFILNTIPFLIIALTFFFAYRAYKKNKDGHYGKRVVTILAAGLVTFYAYTNASLLYGPKGVARSAPVVQTVQPSQAPVENRERAPILDNTQREERYRSQLDYRERIEQSRREAEESDNE